MHALAFVCRLFYYLIDLNNRLHLGPCSQLNHIRLAFPTICVSGTNPQNRLSWLL